MFWSNEDIEKAKLQPKRYKCDNCGLFVNEDVCPVCGRLDLPEACILDHCDCGHEIISSYEFCPVCGEPVCPICGSHDVVIQSRITGYLSEFQGWNHGKRAEFKDRKRYTVSARV